MSHSERTHLAQELHDGIAQDLVGVGYSLDLLLSAPETPIATRIDLRTLRFSIDDLLEKVRGEIHQLHASSGKNLSVRIEESAKILCPGIISDLILEDIPIDPDGEIAYGVHQIARECLRNIALHSQAKSLYIELSSTRDELRLYIRDDGTGGMIESEARFGIVGVKKRTSSLGGTLLIESTSGGTAVEVRIPISQVLTT